MLEKRKSRAFRKDIYLVGKDKEGKLVWLEAPSWDCGWYWGFGYMEIYTNNVHPERAKDIVSHSHWNEFVGKVEIYDVETGQFIHTDYKYHINESPLLSETVLTENESWLISDLMKSFYTLKEAAAVLGNGDSHYASDPSKTCQDTELANKINQEILPKLFEQVISILTPKE
jgi:hypothetical protein